MSSKMKYPRSSMIKNVSTEDAPSFYIMGSKGSEKISSLALGEYQGVQHQAVAHGGSRTRRDFSDLATNVSGRPGFTRRDYDYHRDAERVPTQHFDILHTVNSVYKRVGIVRHIIDLMGDFVVQGVRVVHPNPFIQTFYQDWFNRVNGLDRSERFANSLYRTGKIIITRKNARIKPKKKFTILKSLAEVDVVPKELRVKGGEVPWKYTFLNPQVVHSIGGRLSALVDDPVYGIKLDTQLKMMIKSPKTPAERAIVEKLPDEVKKAAQTTGIFILPPEKTLAFHYKKDDWEEWASPMIYSVLDDIFMLEKLRLADLSALDGAISNIRIFKLGDIEHKIAPTSAAVSRLAEILESNVGGGTIDIIWGPDIELLESKTTADKFLGISKYESTYDSIHAGLGVPQTLTGTAKGGGATNNFMSLKTLVQNLTYGRTVLTSFWEHEFRLVQKAMGFRQSATLEFDIMALGSEEAEKALWIQLADRNLVSDELLQRRFGKNLIMLIRTP